MTWQDYIALAIALVSLITVFKPEASGKKQEAALIPIERLKRPKRTGTPPPAQ